MNKYKELDQLRTRVAQQTEELANLNNEFAVTKVKLERANKELSEVYSDFNLVGERLQDEAEDRDWCSAYDNFIDFLNERMTRLQFPTREREYEVTFDLSKTMTAQVTVTVTAKNEDDALDIARDSNDFFSLSDKVYGNWDIDDYDVEDSSVTEA